MDISIEDPKKKFDDHINQPSNDRILFSGKFGTGKSHFLREYFKDHKEYNVFWISPVNYVVGNNQDIFEWIKIDIAKQLLSDWLPEDKEKKIPDDFLIQSFIYQNVTAIFKRLLFSVADKLQEKVTGTNFLTTFRKEIDAFKEYKKKETGDEETDTKELVDFITDATLAKGSIFEDDFITRIVRASIELFNKEKEKKSVLIIDDLDRLDPEHIFRILNILSCHNDHFDSNKFGFNKVILVCDIHNIEVIYKHKYGEADFEGYMEKFYSYEPFYYSIRSSIIEFCKQNINLKGIDNANINVLSIIICSLIDVGVFKIRNLSKILNSKSLERLELPVKSYQYNLNMQTLGFKSFINAKEITVDFNYFNFLQVLYILIKASGGISNFRNLINKITFNHVSNNNDYQDIFYSICILSAFAQNKIFRETNVFFDNSSSPNTAYRTRLMPPTIQCLNISATIKIRWNFLNMYTDGNYFDDYQIEIKNILNLNIDVGFFRKEISDILDYLINEKILTNIDTIR